MDTQTAIQDDPASNLRRLSTAVRPVLLSSLILLTSTGDLLAQEMACRRVSLLAVPNWISAAVGYEGDRLSRGLGTVTVQPVTNQLVLYNLRGKGRALGKFGQKTFLPSAIRQKPDGSYVLKLAGNKLLELDADLRRARNLEPLQDPAAGTGLSSLYDWTVTNDRLVAYGSVKAPDTEEGYRLGFLTAPLSSLDKPELLMETKEGDFYLYNQPYFASIDDRSFFVRFTGGESILYEVDSEGNIRELKDAVPEHYRRAPVIHTPNEGPETAALIYAEISRQSIVAGLFNIQNELFLLTRHPIRDGAGALWRLFDINLETGKPGESSLILPTTAPHISLATAGDAAFVFEKDMVVGLGTHPIRSMRTFSLDWLTDPSGSPLQEKRMAVSPVPCNGS